MEGIEDYEDKLRNEEEQTEKWFGFVNRTIYLLHKLGYGIGRKKNIIKRKKMEKEIENRFKELRQELLEIREEVGGLINQLPEQDFFNKGIYRVDHILSNFGISISACEFDILDILEK